MGKRSARRAFIGKPANANRVHVNDPTRRKAPKHDSVKKATKKRLQEQSASLASGLPDTRPTGPHSGDVIPKMTSKPVPQDEFGNPLYPNNDAFFDGGADTQ